MNVNGRKFEKIDYFFEKDNLPSNYKYFQNMFPDCRVGCYIIKDFFSDEELKEIENDCWKTEQKGL